MTLLLGSGTRGRLLSSLGRFWFCAGSSRLGRKTLCRKLVGAVERPGLTLGAGSRVRVKTSRCSVLGKATRRSPLSNTGVHCSAIADEAA